MSDGETVEIARLGAKGDGLVAGEGGPRFVPFALPRERWRIGDGAPELITASPERAAPPCRHFSTCGGCVAQHMSPALYEAWKREIVAEAFRHRGLEAEIAPIARVPLHSRRRAFLGVERRGQRVRIGFREEGQHTLVELVECPVLDAAIVAALKPLREIARLVMAEATPGRLVVTRLDHGLDVAFENGLKALAPEVRAAIAGIAERARLVRVTVAGELIVERAPPVLTLGGVAVEPVPGAFLQAVPEAERMLADLVLAALPRRAKRVADLFAGLGTLTFPLAHRVAVDAFDGDKRAIAALETASRRVQGLKPIAARVRDLMREPLSSRELDGYDAVVLDPPRAGAAAQAERLARSKVPIVIMVSCAPATLARDVRALVDGGYGMGPVTPVDQFLFSPHVEAVVVLRR